jgi:hypothetical protein
MDFQMAGRKTHDQFERVIQRRSALHRKTEDPIKKPNPEARQSEFAVSEGGINQESSHNKHNHAHKGAEKH